MTEISDLEFTRFQRFIHAAAGISLSPAKKMLVAGRLGKRLHACGVNSYGAYFELLSGGQAQEEVQTAIDLLTTNETYFFREPSHFDLLREVVAARPATPFRAWSAAASSGEEAFSIAMVLADVLGSAPWEIVGTDISQRILARARTGHYPMERARQVPPDYLKRYCLRGQDEQAGTLLVDRALRQRVQFVHANLNDHLPKLGMFDIVFLRNVMIYFDRDTKRSVVERLAQQIKPGGTLCIGHSETLNDVTDVLRSVAPSVYRKP